MIRTKTTSVLQNILMASAAVVLILTSTGCHLVSSAAKSVPAHRLDPNLFDCPRESLVPVPFSALGQPKPQEHVIGAGDTLAIYIFGVFPANEEETPILQRSQALNQRYYPARGSVVGPATGLPIRVDDMGNVDLPLIGPISLQGKTMAGAIESIREAYRKERVLKEGLERITVTLIMPRVRRVVVLREDTPSPNVALVPPVVNAEIHRGSGEVIDLPVYENDVLHALAATGGLPGTDAARELFVIRREAAINPAMMNAQALEKMTQQQAQGEHPHVIRIPLATRPCDTFKLHDGDTILEEGDVLFVPRRNEYFVAGGLLPGGRIALPRDEDIDVIEAIAMASGSAGGPLGLDGGVLSNGRPGYIREATRVMILRKLPDGRQMNIRVDLDRAINDAKERIRIMPDDVVMLHQKPGGAFMNVTMNWIGGTWVPNAFLVNAD